MFDAPLNFNDYVRPICPTRAQSGEWMAPGDPIRVCGWGTTEYMNDAYPSELHCVETSYVSLSTCNDRNHYDSIIPAGSFCAGSAQETIDYLKKFYQNLGQKIKLMNNS